MNSIRIYKKDIWTRFYHILKYFLSYYPIHPSICKRNIRKKDKGLVLLKRNINFVTLEHY